jgi:hypothetical protein
MSENYQTYQFHNTFTKKIYQTHHSTYQKFSELPQSVTVMSGVLVLSEKCRKQIIWMYQSHFIVLLQSSVRNCSSVVQYPFRLFLMSCPICTVTAKNRSMSHNVMSEKGKMRTVLSLTSPSTVSGTGLFVPPLDGCNSCEIQN